MTVPAERRKNLHGGNLIYFVQGCQPPRHEILRIGREENMIDDVILHDKFYSFVQKMFVDSDRRI